MYWLLLKSISYTDGKDTNSNIQEIKKRAPTRLIRSLSTLQGSGHSSPNLSIQERDLKDPKKEWTRSEKKTSPRKKEQSKLKEEEKEGKNEHSFNTIQRESNSSSARSSISPTLSSALSSPSFPAVTNNNKESDIELELPDLDGNIDSSKMELWDFEPEDIAIQVILHLCCGCARSWKIGLSYLVTFCS